MFFMSFAIFIHAEANTMRAAEPQKKVPLRCGGDTSMIIFQPTCLSAYELACGSALHGETVGKSEACLGLEQHLPGALRLGV